MVVSELTIMHTCYFYEALYLRDIGAVKELHQHKL